MTAAIRGNYSIVKVLYADGYRIFDKLADDRFFFSRGSFRREWIFTHLRRAFLRQSNLEKLDRISYIFDREDL